MEKHEQEFIHPKLNNQITAIGGKYVLIKEDKISIDGEEVLYLTGVAVFDSTCCGSGGCSYALVPGFVRRWKFKTDDDGNPISVVVPLPEGPIRDKLKNMILKKESVYQVDFL